MRMGRAIVDFVPLYLLLIIIRSAVAYLGPSSSILFYLIAFEFAHTLILCCHFKLNSLTNRKINVTLSMLCKTFCQVKISGLANIVAAFPSPICNHFTRHFPRFSSSSDGHFFLASPFNPQINLGQVLLHLLYVCCVRP